jgi:hypothetical protein
MRSGLIGFILGVALMILALVLAQQRLIRDIEPDLSFRFSSYVFDGTEFPQGDFEQGRLVHRSLFPARFTTTFYNAEYQQVTRADKPGRYGAVVRMSFFGGNTVYRFITLYRTPERVYWGETPIPISVQLPEVGLDPAVVRAQATEIGEATKESLIGHGEGSPQLAILLAGLSETAPTDAPAVARNSVFARDANWWYGLRDRLGLAPKYQYLVDLPRDYDADPTKRWPLIFYVTTATEAGTDLAVVRGSGLAREIGSGRQIPAVVISPQEPPDQDWSLQALAHLLDEVCAKYRIDPDRVYLTGETKTWELAAAYPERFAAINPICGECDPADAARLKDIPVWAFYGTEQLSSSLDQTNAMIGAIRLAGGHAHLTLSDGNHDSWDQAYAMDSLYTWLLAQKRGQVEVMTPGVQVP